MFCRYIGHTNHLDYSQWTDSGDLNISGTGPGVARAREILQEWPESYGYIPRSYEDTESPGFWRVCNDVSEGFYIDAFSRICFAGDAQERTLILRTLRKSCFRTSRWTHRLSVEAMTAAEPARLRRGRGSHSRAVSFSCHSSHRS